MGEKKLNVRTLVANIWSEMCRFYLCWCFLSCIDPQPKVQLCSHLSHWSADTDIEVQCLTFDLNLLNSDHFFATLLHGCSHHTFDIPVTSSRNVHILSPHEKLNSVIVPRPSRTQHSTTRPYRTTFVGSTAGGFPSCLCVMAWTLTKHLPNFTPCGLLFLSEVHLRAAHRNYSNEIFIMKPETDYCPAKQGSSTFRKHKCGLLRCADLSLLLHPLSAQWFPRLHQPLWCSERLAAGSRVKQGPWYGCSHLLQTRQPCRYGTNTSRSYNPFQSLIHLLIGFFLFY